jgi:hypothetical protein
VGELEVLRGTRGRVEVVIKHLSRGGGGRRSVGEEGRGDVEMWLSTSRTRILRSTMHP